MSLTNIIPADILSNIIKKSHTPDLVIDNFTSYLIKQYPENLFIVVKHQISPNPYLLQSQGEKAKELFREFVGFSKISDALNCVDRFDCITIYNNNQDVDFIFVFKNILPSEKAIIAGNLEILQNIYGGIITREKLYRSSISESNANLISQLAHDMNSLIAQINLPYDNKELNSKAVYIDKLIPELLLFIRDIKLIPVTLSLGNLLPDVIDASGLSDRIDTKFSSKDLQISCDVELLNHAFAAVLNNAIIANNSSPSSVIVTIEKVNNYSLYIDKDWVKIEITDNGPGIPEEFLPLIFKPFFTTRKSKGHPGLGLSLAQKIFHAHGGEIYITNNNIGISVSIYLPLVQE